MTLDKAVKKKWYMINSLEETSGDLNSRFNKLGFIPGVKVILVRKAPLFCDPLLFQIEDNQIALTKVEAQQIKIKEMG